MTKELGSLLGTALIWKGVERSGRSLSERMLKAHVEDVCNDSAALREVVKHYPWFLTLLKRARICNFSLNSTVSTKLECLEEMEAKVIGNNLMPCLKTRKVAIAGVDAWRLQNRAVGELFKEFPWLQGTFERLGEGVVKSAPWGMMFRVLLGATTSTFDLATDYYVTYMFWSDGKEGYFKASLASLAVSLFLQTLIITISYQNLGLKRVFKELLPILLGVRPGYEAYKVASGQEQESGQLFDPLMEMIFTQSIEVFAEAIPGVLIQLDAIFSSEKRVLPASWVSLVVSLLSTGFIGATMSYDFDTDPSKREDTPHFYGYVPANPTKRTIVFTSMVIFSAGMLLIRCTTLVVLRSIGTLWMYGFLCFDLCLFLLVKMLRNDFWYWIPSASFFSEFLLSLSLRIGAKIVTDFTSMVQFRHPQEVGGFYWTICSIITIVSLPVTLKMYETKNNKAENDKNLGLLVGVIVIPISILSFFIFFLNIERMYLRTFVSQKTTNQHTAFRFQSATSDESRSNATFAQSRRTWRHFEDNVEAWVRVNWERWVDEKPKWFLLQRPNIPISFIPDKHSRRLETRRRTKQKSSLGLRASIRRRITSMAFKGKINPVLKPVLTTQQSIGWDKDEETSKTENTRSPNHRSFKSLQPIKREGVSLPILFSMRPGEATEVIEEDRDSNFAVALEK